MEWNRRRRESAVEALMPDTASPAVLALQKTVAKHARGTLSVWFGRVGWMLAAGTGLLLVLSGLVVGWEATGEVLIGVTSPAAEYLTPLAAVMRWAVALVGWLAVPALMGAVVGYAVSQQAKSVRGRTLDEIEAGREFDGD